MSAPVEAKKKPTPPAVLAIRRRKFLRTLAVVATTMGAALAGFIPVLGRWYARLRPPGALAEDEFLAACIKCGQCVQVCPVGAIELADLSDGFGIGTPLLRARDQACDFSCDVMQCVLACPTGALSHDIDFPHQAAMGKAELTRPDACLAVRGEGVSGPARGKDFAGKLRYAEVDRWTPIEVRDHDYDLDSCDLCVRQCPIEIQLAAAESGAAEGESATEGLTAGLAAASAARLPPAHAIRLSEFVDSRGERRLRPEILEGCVGCGVCEMICPAEPACIEVRPPVEDGRRA